MKKHGFKFSQPAVIEMMGFPNTIFGSGPKLECNSDREVIIDGCTGILEYTGDTIRLSAKGMTLKFTGEDLFIGSMERKGLVIRGKINSIEFVR